mmetsp:Transcript_45940/g.98195  ORF Transcript_45940/g.98195 Transcript_45940/m.98195 type:complete len:266 (-) Transcript_45940:167-964(-)
MSLKRHLPPLAPGPAALPARSPSLPGAGTLRSVTPRGACLVGLLHRLVLVGLLPDSRLLFVPQADALIKVAKLLPNLFPPLLPALTLLLAVGGELPLLEIADQFSVLACAGGIVGILLARLFHKSDIVSRAERTTAGHAGAGHFGARRCRRQDLRDCLHRSVQQWHDHKFESEWLRHKRKAAKMTSKGHRQPAEDRLGLDRETFWLILPLGVLRLEGLLEHLAAITEDQVLISRHAPGCLSVVGASTLRTCAGRGGGPRVRFLGL